MAQQSHAKPVTDTKLPKARLEQASESEFRMPSHSQQSSKPPPSSVLPPDFFDNKDDGKPRSGMDLG